MMLSSLMERLTINSIILFVLTGIIVLMKRLLKNHLTHKAQYRIWYMLLFVLAIPFLPLPIIRAGHGLGLFGSLGGMLSQANPPASSPLYRTGISSLLEDFFYLGQPQSLPAFLFVPSLSMGSWGWSHSPCEYNC